MLGFRNGKMGRLSAQQHLSKITTQPTSLGQKCHSANT
uniref:Uncharacterized protein n=1 Tax=Arundo donax TaxID=35708 RepID=A0A0A9BUX7_ARUDO